MAALFLRRMMGRIMVHIPGLFYGYTICFLSSRFTQCFEVRAKSHAAGATTFTIPILLVRDSRVRTPAPLYPNDSPVVCWRQACHCRLPHGYVNKCPIPSGSWYVLSISTLTSNNPWFRHDSPRTNTDGPVFHNCRKSPDTIPIT